MLSTFRLTAIMVMLGLASAQCQMSNALAGNEATEAAPSQLCLPQGEGSWTFALSISAVDVPAFEGGLAGYSGSSAFIIYDNYCNEMGVYSQPSCGVPYTIEENFLADVLTLTSIDTGLGGGYFSFLYGDGEYSINNNGCLCQDMSSGLEGAQGCRCAFPVDGVFAGKIKRNLVERNFTA